MVRFLPAFVGSKAHWVPTISKLLNHKKCDIIEPCCGSAIISANLAKSATLIDIDPYVCRILSRFDELEVPEVFTQEDYFIYRGVPEWWKYSYYLQKFAFSSVFRHTKSGFNVPVKKHIKSASLRSEYEKALKVWRKIKPTVINASIHELVPEMFRDKVVILDPPYEGSQTVYNYEFDYQLYWELVETLQNIAQDIFLFDTSKNIETHLSISQISFLAQRKMRVNGKYDGDIETLVRVKTAR